MKLLLDTHAFIEWDENPARMGTTARVACQNPNNELALSLASVWGIQLQRAVGKPTQRNPLRQLLDDQVLQNGLEIIPVSVESVLQLDSLPLPHRDPLDRILIATAPAVGWTVVSPTVHSGLVECRFCGESDNLLFRLGPLVIRHV